MDKNDVISTLNNLITTCHDGQYGFQEAAENVESPELKQFFHEASLERARYAGELQGEVKSLGGDPATEGSTAATIHRAWIDIKGSLTGKSDESILNEAERGEDSAVEAYEDALEENKLPAQVRAIVERQYAQVKQVHDRVRALRNARANT